MFKQNPDKKIRKSKFASLRPGQVLSSSQMSRNVCVCRQHQNMALILHALHKFDETFPLYSHVLPQTLVCNSDIDFCCSNICESCKDAQLSDSLQGHCTAPSLPSIKTWRVWVWGRFRHCCILELYFLIIFSFTFLFGFTFLYYHLNQRTLYLMGKFPTGHVVTSRCDNYLYLLQCFFFQNWQNIFKFDLPIRKHWS